MEHGVYKEHFAVAMDAAKQAGEILVAARQGGGLSRHYKGGIELVTSADEQADAVIRRRIHGRFPDHAILSEEGPASDVWQAGRPGWLVDPVDGTVNFVHGSDFVSVSIAFTEREHVQVAVVHAPFLNQTFSAIRGAGAWCNDRSLRNSGQESLRDALIGTGFPHDRVALGPVMRRLENVLRHCQDVRRFGSPALDICFVATGRLDGFYENLAVWDVAAAALIARESGAKCGHLHPPPDGTWPDLYGQGFVVSSPGIFNSLVAALLAQSD